MYKVEKVELNKEVSVEGKDIMFETITANIHVDDNGYRYMYIVNIRLNEDNEIVSSHNSEHPVEEIESDIKLIVDELGRLPMREEFKSFSKLNQRQKNIVNKVYEMLQDSDVYPSGSFGSANKFFADNSHLISCRAPSRAFPYSELNACRTKKYVARVLQYYNCKSVKTLLKHI